MKQNVGIKVHERQPPSIQQGTLLCYCRHPLHPPPPHHHHATHGCPALQTEQCLRQGFLLTLHFNS